MHLALAPGSSITLGLLVACVAAGIGAGGATAAEPANAPQKSVGRISFDIPAQPLVTALDAYSSATGLEVLYDSALAAGHSAAPVKGSYTAREAVALLLGGSGLTARPIGVGAITITPAPAAGPAPIAPGPVPSPVSSPGPAESPYAAYFALIQQRFETAFCQDAHASPGNYRAVLKFTIEPTGRIVQAELLGSTGSSQRDRAIAQALGRVSLGEPPPDLPQPVMLLILPQSAGKVADCPASP